MAAGLAELAGADQITVHLREDRRHIQDRDVRVLRETVQVPLNLEMAATDEMVAIALEVGPDIVTLVPESREERTTEGGLDVVREEVALTAVSQRLQAAGIAVSLFVDPAPLQIEASRRTGAQVIELHTGDYCEAQGPERAAQYERLEDAARLGKSLGLRVVAGHGIDYRNVDSVAAIPEIEELNIGHSIVCRAVLVGFERAVVEMIEAMERAVR